MTTIRDIANLAGVSIATVSRALTKPELVKPATIALVRAAVEKANYRPNAVASSLRRQRSNNIIVVVPNIHNPFFSSVIQGIENVAHDNGFKILLGETQDDQHRLDLYADMLSTKSADGLILLGSLLPSIVNRALAGQLPIPIPLVLACERFDGLTCPSVQIDNVAASELATSHLVAQGHKRVATITGPLHNLLGRDRLDGFRNALRRGKLKAPKAMIVEGDFSIASGYRGMLRLLALEDRPTGVFCASDEMALGALKAIAEAGLRVPQDVALVGFDDIRFAAYSMPSLTTIAQPSLEIGESAMRLMLNLLVHPVAAAEHIILSHQLIVRDSSVQR